jgi:hypothetical protein
MPQVRLQLGPPSDEFLIYEIFLNNQKQPRENSHSWTYALDYRRKAYCLLIIVENGSNFNQNVKKSGNLCGQKTLPKCARTITRKPFSIIMVTLFQQIVKSL